MVRILDELQGRLTAPRDPRRPWVRPATVCADGFTLSIQASSSHACAPATDEGPYTHVELGFPSVVEPLLFGYASEPGAWTSTIYPWVPIEVAAAVVELHGGLAPQVSLGADTYSEERDA